jgi:tetraacyldisaccharide 4'-kinase
MSPASRTARWAALWRRASLSRSAAVRLLLPIAWLYGGLVRRRRRRYLASPARVVRLPVPVIVVGNVVVGGAGKTPVTIAVIRHLQQRGRRPGLVSRGYGRRGDEVLLLPEQPDPARHGDEPTLIRLLTGVPACVGADRAAAAHRLLEACPEVDVVVCDDGLQHYGLARDLAIAVFDDRGVGNGWLLPAGPLREPWPPSDLDAFTPHVLLQMALPGASVPPLEAPPRGMAVFHARRRLANVVHWADGRSSPLEELRGRAHTLVAGIARPEVFFDMVRARGLAPSRHIALPDHAGAEALKGVLSALDGTILCTEKDAVKLFPWWRGQPGRERWQIGAIPLDTDIEPAFFALLDERVSTEAAPPATSALSSGHGHETA